MLWLEVFLVYEVYFSFDLFESIIFDLSYFKNKIVNRL